MTMSRRSKWRVWEWTVLPWLKLFHRFELITGVHTGTFELWFSRQFHWMIRETPEEYKSRMANRVARR